MLRGLFVSRPMRFEVTTLGTGAALPARGRYPTAQLLNIHERLFLVIAGRAPKSACAWPK